MVDYTKYGCLHNCPQCTEWTGTECDGDLPIEDGTAEQLCNGTDGCKSHHSQSGIGENDKAKMLRKWMRDLTGYWGKDSDKTKYMRDMFADYIWDGRTDA